MSKIALILVVAAVAVAAQAFPYRPNDIASAIILRDWDALHEQLMQTHRDQFYNGNVHAITPIRYQRPFAVPQYAIPQARAFAGVGPLSPHSVGSGLAASISSRTDSAGHTTVQHQEHGFTADGKTIKQF